MRKLFPISLFVLFFIGLSNVYGQCPGCTINTACYIPGGGLCPDSIPAGTQGQPYDEDVTAYLPGSIDAAPFSGGVLGIVPLVSVHLDAISGLPFGLNWTCDHPGNNFYPSTGDTLGCVKICGTPISAPGVYNIVIDVTAGVDAGPVLGIQYAQIAFDIQMVLLASTSGNLAFNYTPSSACESGDFDFTPIISAPLPQIVTYDWDFGTSTYSGPTPPTQTFSSPGDYVVTLVTTISSLTLTDLNTTATNNWWCGDIEEPNWPVVGCTAAPDLYFKFTHGSTTYQSGSGSDNNSESWSGINEKLSSTSVALSIWDYDPTSADDDGGTWTGTVNATGVYGYNTSSPHGGGTSGSFTIGLSTDTVITVTDTIHVYPNPGVPALSASAMDFCPGDSIELTTTPGFSYEWYLNDSMLVATGPSNTYWVTQGGDYKVIMFDPITGCSNTSATITITEHAGIPNWFAIDWDTPNGWMESNVTGSYTYQWQVLTGSWWIDVPAPEGNADYYIPPANGEYQLIITGPDGCTDTAYYNFNTFGIEDQNLVSQVSVYPNPASESFTLSLEDLNAQSINVSIYNMIGQSVFSRKYHVSGNSFVQVLDISSLSNGVYMIDINIDQFNIRKKLIKE